MDEVFRIQTIFNFYERYHLVTKASQQNNSERNPYAQSLARGLSILKTFDADHTQMTLSQIALRTELSRAAARRCLLTLHHLGYISVDGRNFQLAAKVLDLGFGYLSSLSVPENAQPHLELLASKINESASASVLDGTDIVYVARVPIRRIMSIRVNIGTRMPAHATSMGRVLLSGLTHAELTSYVSSIEMPQYTSNTITSKIALMKEITKVRSNGYSIVDRELEYGLRSIAVPILSSSKRIIAAINVATASQSNTLESLKKSLLNELKDTAARISEDLASTRQF